MFGKKRGDSPGYEDKQALSGFGGYQPSDSPGYTPSPVEPASEPTPEPPKPAKQPMSRSGRRAMYGFFATLGVIAVAALANNGSDRSSSSSTPRAPTVYTPSPRVVAPPVTDGWQSVAGADGLVAYDVPPNWTPKPGTIHGWEKTALVPGISMFSSAFVGDDYCPAVRGSRIGGSGLATVKVADAPGAANKALYDLVVSAYNPEEGPLSAKIVADPPQATEFTLGTGAKAPANILIAEVTLGYTGACIPKRALVGVQAVDMGDASAALLVYSDQDQQGSADREQILKILKTYRGVPEADRKTITPPPSTLR
ncbi:hypothetical protein ACFQ05_00305 [Amycolatopsis umgeniensis]|uniref:DUF8017 domain-containing protein n=1 Tax=Amycolatopsis umgeniensis TaxID=336628 RepID=A0A841AZJ0_9PSEU|nr:hypothetical protein [Amycolatopsis umgeniensis]MBB5851694.1 hypothetical protein [Amycolatopsis umgeniensis]